MTHSESKQAMLAELGAVPVVADALDADQVADAVAHARPDVIVHQLTAIGAVDLRHFERSFAPTNRLRIEGTDHLLSAGHAVGVRRFVAQSNGAFAYARTGGAVKGEEDLRPLAPSGDAWDGGRASPSRAGGARRRLDGGDRVALRRVLRAGHLDGVGRAADRDGPPAQVPAGWRRRRRVVVHPCRRRGGRNGGRGRHGSRGVYNVVDDDPAPVAEWLPALAQELGAKKPMRVPRFVGRLFAGEIGVMMMTELRGASNAKAKRELQWCPAHPSWRQGLAAA